MTNEQRAQVEEAIRLARFMAVSGFETKDIANKLRTKPFAEAAVLIAINEVTE